MANPSKFEGAEKVPGQPADQKYEGANDEYRGTMSAVNRRLEKLEDMQSILEKLVPKIDDICGFVTHKSPHLATKDDVSALKTDLQDRIHMETVKLNSEISKRPTTSALYALAALFLAACALPYVASWLHAVRTEVSGFTNPPASSPATPKQQ